MQNLYYSTYLAHSKTVAFQKKVEDAKALTAAFLNQRESRGYAAFSGGKDSTCLLILLREIGRSDVPVFTCIDDLSFPGLEAHCRYVAGFLGFRDHIILRAERNAMDPSPGVGIHAPFFSSVGRFSKVRGVNDLLLGLRAQEDNRYFFNLIRKRTVYKIGHDETICAPIARWTGLDVFALILSRQIPYFHIYDKDDDRPPHEIRLSWMLNPEFFSRGQVAWLKRHYPDYYNLIANRYPNLITSLA